MLFLGRDKVFSGTLFTFNGSQLCPEVDYHFEKGEDIPRLHNKVASRPEGDTDVLGVLTYYNGVLSTVHFLTVPPGYSAEKGELAAWEVIFPPKA